MEEKVVGEKKESSLFSDISFTLLSIASLSSVFIYTAPALDLRTTPLWFTDNTGSCVRLNEQYSTGQSDPNGRHQWNGKVGDRHQHQNSSPQTLAFQDRRDGKHPSHGQWLSCLARRTPPRDWISRRDGRIRAAPQSQEQKSFRWTNGGVQDLHAITNVPRTEEGIGRSQDEDSWT